MATVSMIPGRLWQPPTSTVDPPVDTLIQDLPLDKLEWADFERLCTKLASRDAKVEHAQQYGVPGQEQQGIDIYARKVGTDRYTAWQCKRSQSITAAKIRTAAEQFLAGDWASRSDVFHLCLTARIEDRTVSDEIEALVPAFAQRNIAFVPLGKLQISERLKTHPDLVHDFFGREWVAKFCGEDAAARLSGRKLSPQRIAQLRELLHQLYVAHFNALDPGLPSATHEASISIPFADRFVMPDVLEQRLVGGPESPNEAESGGEREAAGRPLRSRRFRPDTQEVRSSLSSWFGQNRLSTIIGDAGRGKTTLLRAIALDLLSNNPRHETWARTWGDRIPVWIPFALWVRGVACSAHFGLSDLISTWLSNLSARPELQELLADAIDDDRLLLLVDGIDEWTNETAAGVTLTLLQTFVGARNVSAIATSRPLGHQRLGGLGAEWAIGNLAPFSTWQQVELATVWFKERETSRAPTDSSEASGHRAKENAHKFVIAVAHSSALSQLASTPLLLTGLIALHLAGERLPRSRFRAYERLSTLLTHEHPHRRLRSTLAPGGNTWSADTRDRVLDILAYAISVSDSPTSIDYDAARGIAADYLMTSLSRPAADATEQGRTLIDELRDSHGVLVERSSRELGFLHKSFQDFHAARWLSREPLERQRAFVRAWASVPHAHEVILSLCFLTTRSVDVDFILDELERMRDEISPYVVDALVAEVAFSELNSSPRRASDIAERSFHFVATEEWQPARVRLVNTVLDGLNSDLLRPRVLQVLSEWFPQRSRRVYAIYSAMAEWRPQPDVIDALMLGLGREEIADRHAAARAIGKLAASQANIQARLVEIMFLGDAGTAAASLNALAVGWPQCPATLRRLDEARNSRSDEVRVVSALRRVSIGVQDSRDLEILLDLASEGSSFQPRYEFRREIAEAVVRGWPNDERIRSACLASIRERWGDRRELKVDIAAPILLGGYAIADDIAESIADVFHDSEFLDHRLSDDWSSLLNKYRRHPKIATAIDDWLQTYESNTNFVDAVNAAALSGSDAAKQYILSHREHQWASPYWSAEALLAGWQRGDAEIDAALAEMTSTPAKAQHVGNLIPRIVTDPERAEAILFGILEQDSPYRIDGAVQALHALGHDHRNTRFADAVFRHDLVKSELGYGSTFADILTALHGDSRARELCLRELASRDPQADVIARFFGEDRELRPLLLRITRGLPQALRQTIAERLSTAADDDPDAAALLGEYDMDVAADVKVLASAGYWSGIHAQDGIDASALTCLNADIRATGFDFEDRRQAAFAAFLAINRADIPATARHQVGGQLTNIRDHLARRAGTPLLRLIAQKWTSVHEAFGEDLWEKVSGERGSSIEAFASFADENHELREALVKRIEVAPTSELGEATILLIAREQRKSEFVKAKLLDVLRDPELDWYAVSRKLVAVDALGRDFHHPAVADALADLAAIGNDEALIGLCDWWPDHKYVCDLQIEGQTTIRRYRRYVPMSIAVATYDCEALVDFLAGTFGRFRGDIWEFHPRSTEALVRRLSRDESLRAMTASRLTVETPSSDEKASWPGLLRRAGAFTPAVAEWCAAEIVRQQQTTIPDYGIDATAGAIRSVRRALLDAVAPL